MGVGGFEILDSVLVKEAGVGDAQLDVLVVAIAAVVGEIPVAGDGDDSRARGRLL